MKLDHCDSCVAELKQQLTLKWCFSMSEALLFFFVFPPFFLWVSQWLALSPLRKKVPDLKLEDGCGRSVSLHVRASGVPNLAVGMNVSVCGCMCLSVNPVVDRQTVHGGPHLSPQHSLEKSKTPVYLK